MNVGECDLCRKVDVLLHPRAPWFIEGEEWDSERFSPITLYELRLGLLLLCEECLLDVMVDWGNRGNSEHWIIRSYVCDDELVEHIREQRAEFERMKRRQWLRVIDGRRTGT